MSEAGIDGFPGNPVRVIGKSSEVENVQITPVRFESTYLINTTPSTFQLCHCHWACDKAFFSPTRKPEGVALTFIIHHYVDGVSATSILRPIL